MEQKIAIWSTAVVGAAIVALIIFGAIMELADAETVRSAAEKGAIFLALCVAVSSFS